MSELTDKHRALWLKMRSWQNMGGMTDSEGARVMEMDLESYVALRSDLVEAGFAAKAKMARHFSKDRVEDVWSAQGGKT